MFPVVTSSYKKIFENKTLKTTVEEKITIVRTAPMNFKARTKNKAEIPKPKIPTTTIIGNWEMSTEKGI